MQAPVRPEDARAGNLREERRLLLQATRLQGPKATHQAEYCLLRRTAAQRIFNATEPCWVDEQVRPFVSDGHGPGSRPLLSPDLDGAQRLPQSADESG